MLWLWHRLPWILSLSACLIYVGGLTPSGRLYVAPPAVSPSLTSPVVEAVESRAQLQVSVRPCELAPGRGAGQPTVRLYRQLGEHYAEVAQVPAGGSPPHSAQFMIAIGGYWLFSSAEGCARDVQWLTVFDESSQHVQVELKRSRPLRVVVRDEDQVPIEGALVLVSERSPVAHGQYTDGRGIAEFRQLPGERNSLAVRAEGFDPARVNQAKTGATVVTLKRLGALSVAVLGPEGQSVAGAVVRLAGGQLPQPLSVVTNDEGLARIVGLERGSYDLRAETEHLVSPSRLGLVLGSGQERTVALGLGPGQFVSVQVVDGSLAQKPPVADARVVLVEQGLGPFPAHGWTNDKGRVRLGPLPGGEAFLSVSAEGYVPVESVAVGGQASRRIELLASGVLHGRVVDAEGRGVSGARLELVGNDVFGRPIALRSGTRAVRRAFFSETGAASALTPVGQLGVTSGAIPHFSSRPLRLPDAVSWQTDESGQFSLRDVPPGRLRVLVSHRDFAATVSEAISLTPGQSAYLTVTVLGGAVVEGIVVDTQGQLQAGSRVDLVAQHGAELQTTFTDEQGHFAFSDVPRAIELRAARPDDASHLVLESRYTVAPQSVLNVTLQLPELRGVAEVAVKDAEGYPVDDARVSIVSLQPDVPFRRSVYVDAEGVAEVEEASGLHAELTVDAPNYRVEIARFSEFPSRHEVKLVPALALSGEVTEVRGRRALEGAEVEWNAGRQLLRTTTDRLGAFRLERVPPAAGWLTITKPGFARYSRRVSLDSATSAARGEHVLPPIDLSPGGAVEGMVVDEAGRAVPNARVGQGLIPAFLPVGSSPAGFVQTDSVGRFHLGQLPSGFVQLSAYAVDVGRGSVQSVEVRASEVTTGVEIQLRGYHPDTEPGALANVAVTLGERRTSGRREVVIVHVAHPSEASRAGLVVGDVVVSVDGIPAQSLEGTRAQLGGPEGSDLVLVVRRQGAELGLAMRRQAVRR